MTVDDENAPRPFAEGEIENAFEDFKGRFGFGAQRRVWFLDWALASDGAPQIMVPILPTTMTDLVDERNFISVHDNGSRRCTIGQTVPDGRRIQGALLRTARSTPAAGARS